LPQDFSTKYLILLVPSDVHKREVKAPQYKSSAELIEDMRKHVLELQAEGYLEGVVVHPRPLQHAGRQK